MKIFLSSLSYILLVSFLLTVLGASTSGQNPQKCRTQTQDKSAPQYKVGRTTRDVEGPPRIIIQISVKPKIINRADLIALATRLKKDYCKEQRIDVLIFDDETSAKKWNFSNASPGHERGLAAMKAAYRLDRSTGEEFITYSTAGYIYLKNSNPIEINLSNRSSP